MVDPRDDGGSDPLFRPPESITFAYEPGQSFGLPNVEDEYWYVMDRVWNFDAEVEDRAVPSEKYHKQYQIAEASTLGGNPRLVPEAVLDHEYEPVDKETAAEVV